MIFVESKSSPKDWLVASCLILFCISSNSLPGVTDAVPGVSGRG